MSLQTDEFDHHLLSELTAGMREATRELTPAGAVLARARQRRRPLSRAALPRTVARTTALAGLSGLAAAAVALGTSVALGHGPQHSSTPAASVSTQDGTVAVARTSFRVHVRNWLEQGGGRPDQDYADYTGTYDPVGQRGGGANTLDGRPSALRVVGGSYYVAGADGSHAWTSGTGTLVDALVLDGGRDWGPTPFDSADPAPVLERLRTLGGQTVVTGTDAAAVYRFSYRLPAQDGVAAHTVTGRLSVDRATGLITRLTFATTVVGPDPQIADGDPITFRTVADYSGYGVAVVVAAPPADEVTVGRSKG